MNAVGPHFARDQLVLKKPELFGVEVKILADPSLCFGWKLMKVCMAASGRYLIWNGLVEFGVPHVHLVVVLPAPLIVGLLYLRCCDFQLAIGKKAGYSCGRKRENGSPVG